MKSLLLTAAVVAFAYLSAVVRVDAFAVARCDVGDWTSLNGNYTEPSGKVEISVNYCSGTTETEVFNVFAKFFGQDLEVGSEYASHVHLLACDDVSGGAHWLKIPGSVDDPTNAVFNDLVMTEEGVMGMVVSNFTINSDDDPFLSYVIHDDTGARIMCCDLTVFEDRLIMSSEEEEQKSSAGDSEEEAGEETNLLDASSQEASIRVGGWATTVTATTSFTLGVAPLIMSLW